MSSKKPEAKVPSACIREQHGSMYTWCGRKAYGDEYLFNDAAYAVKHYANGTCLKACPSCVNAVAPIIQDKAYEAPMATRGLKNTR